MPHRSTRLRFMWLRRSTCRPTSFPTPPDRGGTADGGSRDGMAAGGAAGGT